MRDLLARLSRAVFLLPMLLAGELGCDVHDPPAGGLSAVVARGQNDGSAPCSPGAVRDCHEKGEPVGEALTCLQGEQRCVDGVWGTCEGEYATQSGSLHAAAGAGTQVLSAALAETCTDNPCDPQCHRITVDGPADGITVPAGSSLGGGALSGLPGGFQNKGLKDRNHPPFSPCNGPASCQFDHHCDLPSGRCIPWAPGAFDPAAGGADLTVGVPCEGAIPVCNRGSKTSQPGAELVVLSGNSAQLQSNLGQCSKVGGAVRDRCRIDEAIAPGQCVNAADCLPLANGTRLLVVNSPALSLPVPEVACQNNWSASHNGGGTCGAVGGGTFVHEEVYEATCPRPGDSVQWSFLAYDATVPSSASGPASLLIEAHTAAAGSELDASCSDCALVASVPATHPAICVPGAGAKCPVALYDALGAEAARRAALELIFTLAASPDGAAVPKVHGWEIRYTCVPML